MEDVPGFEALGFVIDPVQLSITFQQPGSKTLRTTRGAGPTRIALSGLLARLRLIWTIVQPPSLRLPQTQDLLGLIHDRNPERLLQDQHRRQIFRFICTF